MSIGILTLEEKVLLDQVVETISTTQKTYVIHQLNVEKQDADAEVKKLIEKTEKKIKSMGQKEIDQAFKSTASIY